MKDTQGNNLAANEAGKLNEMTTTTTETAAVSKEATVESVAAGKMTKEEILNKLRNMVEEPVSAVRDEIDSLKQAYYKIRKAEIEELKKTFVEQGGNVKDFNVPEDKYEALLKDLMNTFKEKRAAQIAEEEKLKAANYEVKLQLIEQLKNLCNSNEDFNKLYNEFKEIQQKWKDIKLVPEGRVNELWKEYQNYSEQFYDLIKINSQFRDYDFKKNLELKTALCESVEKLGTTKDTVSAFHQLQKLHQQWREIGPVAKELRESLWARFKAASTVINKRYVQFFEEQKEKELVNLQEKTALCEAVERIDCTLLKSAKDWEKKANEVFEIQKKWKTIGFTPKKHNTKIFERFRAACNVFFAQKSEFFKAMKSEMEENLEKKRRLCEKAEALKDSTDWKETTEKMIALQKEWKTIGQVSFHNSERIWKRFIKACDYFFDNKNKNVPSQKDEEQKNLEAKKALIEKVNALDESLDNDTAVATLKSYMGEWNSIGHVPFKEKDKVYQAFHKAIDAQFDRLKVSRQDRRMKSFQNDVNELAEKGKNKLYSEREKLMRNYERMKSDLQTYENNFGFLNVSSKGGSGLVKELERKIEKLKEEMQLTIKKIETIDENLD